jgi:DNA-binding response OmpR family regulator
MRLLLVEDEHEMAALLSGVLTQQQYLVDHVTTIAMAREAQGGGVHDAIILDRKLPDGDGMTFLREIRGAGDRTPVIVLTAHNMPPERISGLDDGADDYIGKPFLSEELVARLRAVIRRSEAHERQIIREGNITLDLNHLEVTIDSKPFNLPRREALVLKHLLRKAGRTVLRRTLEESVYGFDDEIQSNALDSHVSRLRRKLTEAGATVTIHSIRGLGYLLKAST